MSSIAGIRKDYMQKTFEEEDTAENAFAQFGLWWEEAVKSEIDEVNAMTLATASKDGIPDARIVLLKGYDENGFVFFTNYLSAKGQQMAQNPNACLVFFWKELERQVRISGTVEKISEADSDAYFASRPQGSRIGAWSSPQSQVISARQVIEANAEKYSEQFRSSAIPRPPHWGGYIVHPQVIEFWQGRPSRLHDRIRYTLQANVSWTRERLAP
jgi:pyridoxamine 5'-phosphate oxidase